MGPAEPSVTPAVSVFLVTFLFVRDVIIMILVLIVNPILHYFQAQIAPVRPMKPSTSTRQHVYFAL